VVCRLEFLDREVTSTDRNVAHGVQYGGTQDGHKDRYGEFTIVGQILVGFSATLSIGHVKGIRTSKEEKSKTIVFAH
jgi:hypothetical protein